MQEQVKRPALATMSAPSRKAGNFNAPASVLSTSFRPGNSHSVWDFAPTKNLKQHCVPMTLVVMVACVYWLQDASLLRTPLVGIATTQLLCHQRLCTQNDLLLVVSSEVGCPGENLRRISPHAQTGACEMLLQNQLHPKSGCQWREYRSMEESKIWAGDTTSEGRSSRRMATNRQRWPCSRCRGFQTLSHAPTTFVRAQ